MKAIVCKKYGPPENLEITNLPIPTPGADEILVRVKATTVNDFDWSIVTGNPKIYRYILLGINKPKTPVPGIEMSGTVEATGANIKGFKVGDEVYGDISGQGWGTFAEYVCVKEKSIVHKPESMTFEQAAALPHAAMLAYQGLVDEGKISEGQEILVNGAGGGVGTLAVQIAKGYNAFLTGVDSSEKLELMQSLGFSRVIDYKKEDFTQTGKKYDLILDTKTNRPPSHYLRSLKPKGIYVTVGGTPGKLIQLLLANLFVSIFSKKRLRLLALKPNKDLNIIENMFEKGQLHPVMDGPYPLDSLPRLIDYFGKGEHKGKVVVKVDKTVK